MNNYSLHDIFKKNGYFLNEVVDFYSQKNKTISVYHLTGLSKQANDELNKTALSMTGDLDTRGNLFRPGGGDMYGRGLYTCYKLNKKIAYTYGNTLLEFKVPVQNCLVFVGDEAEAVHGENASLDRQLISILERKGIDYQTNEDFRLVVEKFCEYLKIVYDEKIVGTSTDKSNRTAPDCLSTLRKFSELTKNKIKLKHLIDGIMFFGAGDGPVCVIFNTQLAAINRIGSVVGEDVKIFERPSDIGIDDFDTKTFNQLRRLYSAKSGKGSKEWRAHQRELVNTLNSQIIEFDYSNFIIDKEKLLNIVNNAFKKLRDSLGVSEDFNRVLIELPHFSNYPSDSEFKKLVNEKISSQDKQKIESFYLNYADYMLKELHVEKFLKLQYDFSRELDKLIYVLGGDNISRLKQEIIASLNKISIDSGYHYDKESIIEVIKKSSFIYNDTFDEYVFKIAELVLEIFNISKLFLLSSTGEEEISFNNFKEFYNSDTIKDINSIYTAATEEAVMEVKNIDKSEIELFYSNIAETYRNIILKHKKIIFELLPAEVEKIIKAQYESLDTEIPVSEILENIFVPFNKMLQESNVTFENDLSFDVEEIQNKSLQKIKILDVFETNLNDFWGYNAGFEIAHSLGKTSNLKTSYPNYVMYYNKENNLSSIYETIKSKLKSKIKEDREEYSFTRIWEWQDSRPRGNETITDRFTMSQFEEHQKLSLRPRNIYSKIDIINVDFDPDIK